jgi:hypothetical protein
MDDLPAGPPTNLKVEMRKDTELGYKWEPPACAEQNGLVTQYEYEFSGLDDWNKGEREGVTPRTNTVIDQLMPGSLYRMRVRGYTEKGAGPWSEPLDIRTTGTELGAPRELAAIQTFATAIQLTWLPPYPERSRVQAYKVKYSPRADDSNPVETVISEKDLSCTGYTSNILTDDNICTTVKSLAPGSTYRFAVQVFLSVQD